MSNPDYGAFVLVGGTALALQIGHRISVDLDLFGSQDVKDEQFYQPLMIGGASRLMSKSSHVLVLNINGVKVDFVNYPYSFIKTPVEIDGIRLACLEDIGAMKLAAITGRGRLRDFIDLFFLLKRFTLKELMSFYLEKYPEGSDFLVLRSLTYFQDAETDEMPKMLIPADWTEIKGYISKAVKEF